MDARIHSKIVGKVVRELREERGVSQVELAARMGNSQQTISQYENGGRMPSYEWVLRVCDCIEADPIEFTRRVLLYR